MDDTMELYMLLVSKGSTSEMYTWVGSILYYTVIYLLVLETKSSEANAISSTFLPPRLLILSTACPHGPNLASYIFRKHERLVCACLVPDY